MHRRGPNYADAQHLSSVMHRRGPNYADGQHFGCIGNVGRQLGPQQCCLPITLPRCSACRRRVRCTCRCRSCQWLLASHSRHADNAEGACAPAGIQQGVWVVMDVPPLNINAEIGPHRVQCIGSVLRRACFGHTLCNHASATHQGGIAWPLIGPMAAGPHCYRRELSSRQRRPGPCGRIRR